MTSSYCAKPMNNYYCPSVPKAFLSFKFIRDSENSESLTTLTLEEIAIKYDIQELKKQVTSLKSCASKAKPKST